MKYVALLRGINVGGTGTLPMKDLTALCEGLGWESVHTYIQSGNVVFESSESEAALRGQLERALEVRMGKMVRVMVRTREELRGVLEGNPFGDREPAKVAVVFLDDAPQAGWKKGVIAPDGEQVEAGRRELYVYYPVGMGRSKLKLPLNGAATTARNINTVGRLVVLAEG